MPRRLVRVKRASIFEPVPSEDIRTWQEMAASNRERLTALEREEARTRDALHALRTEAATARYLAEKITELAGDVRELAKRVEQVSRHAVQRPSQSGLAVFGQYIGLIVAIIAIVVAATR